MRRTTTLDGAWQARSHLGIEAALAAAARPAAPDAPDWIPARVPGSILDDLWRAGEVPDPYVERNSRLVEWVGQRAWTYRRGFEGAAAAPGERAWLRFEGIDPAGHVFLDGEPIGSQRGMFLPFEIEIGERLGGAARHELAVVVEPALQLEPQVGRTSRVRHHAARMTAGWDFCPRLLHQGIWRSVELETAGPIRIRDVWARPRLADDLASATLAIEVELDVIGGIDVVLEATLRGPDGRSVATIRVEVQEAARGVARLALDVDRPELWWPNGLGRPDLHQLVVRALGPGGIADERTVPVGFRRIERAPGPGTPAGARPWVFLVNGRRMPITGWNWVPLDALYGVPRPARLRHLLGLAARGHANLLRVWGGGLIESEAFYDACDQLGLLVWQEFSQSSSGVDNAPATDEAFVELMRAEAQAIVPLRRNHPSLAIWCGGNELADAEGRPLDEETPVLGALRDVVARLDPDRIWLPTSPSGRRFHNRLADIATDPDGLEDVHGPWEHQGLRGQAELYDAGTSRFNSEFGVEGMTNRRTHERLIAPEHRWPADRSNPVYRHLGDWWNNAELVQRAFGGRLDDLERLRRASQHLQAEGLRYAVEANRRRWPHNGGSLPWQLNESYPNAWCTAAIDHRGDPKPAFHAVARAYAPTVVCAGLPGQALAGDARLAMSIWAWSIDGSVDRGTVRRRVLGTDGAVHDERVLAVDLRSAEPVLVETAEVALDPSLSGLFFVDLALEAGGSVAATNRYLLARGADLGGLLDLEPASIDLVVERDGDRWCLRLEHRGGPAAVGVRIQDDRPIDTEGWAEAEDDGFELLPGERRSIVVAWAAAPAEGRRLVVDGWNVAPAVVA